MKVGIVGSGLVGSTAAYALVMQGVGREVVLVDRNACRADAEADDLFHAVPFSHPLTVRSGDYDALADSRVVIISAGVNQQPGETRLQLLERNAAVFSEVVPAILRYAPEAVLVVATNPVDVMTHLTAHFAGKLGVPAHRVIGSGTTLDTARFRTLLGTHLGVDSHHIHGYVIGEHGDSEVLTWSLTAVAGLRLDEFCRVRGMTLSAEQRANVDQRVRRAAYHIIQGKGATYYGIGSALARIVDVVLHNQRAVLTVCSPTAEVAGVQDVTLSLPRIVGGQGLIASMPLTLDDAEQAALQRSAGILREAITSLKL
ncbi:L-lactate dehydrogenase [Planctellipticum variicoloris]|uniref:L-lactate dehydrogenase n=1 Tax=Planctellipticum variicoloris TaxID=3064265 RepID=UPI003013412E|nr:L-lactate dehydrogenase [Planctomycetaceae bacterium SH412]